MRRTALASVALVAPLLSACGSSGSSSAAGDPCVYAPQAAAVEQSARAEQALSARAAAVFDDAQIARSRSEAELEQTTAELLFTRRATEAAAGFLRGNAQTDEARARLSVAATHLTTAGRGLREAEKLRASTVHGVAELMDIAATLRSRPSKPGCASGPGAGVRLQKQLAGYIAALSTPGGRRPAAVRSDERRTAMEHFRVLEQLARLEGR